MNKQEWKRDWWIRDSFGRSWHLRDCEFAEVKHFCRTIYKNKQEIEKIDVFNSKPIDGVKPIVILDKKYLNSL